MYEEVSTAEGGRFLVLVVLKRLLSLVPVLLVVGTTVFLLVHLTPGDPAGYMLGPDARQEDIARLRSALGLDMPVYRQYLEWMGRTVQGDLGQSIFLRKPVTAAIADRLEPTLLLTAMATGLALVLGVTLGTVAACRRNTAVDHAIMSLAALGVSVPTFWLGLNLMLLVGVKLKWLPVAGYPGLAADGLSTLRYLILPAVALGVTEAALLARITRSSLIETFRQDFVRTAQAKGLSARVVLFRHTLRNAAVPIITVLGNTIAVLIGGAIVTESVFNVPGLGRLMIQSVLRRDYPVIQGTVLFVAMTYVVINLLLDLVYVRVDPRVHYS